MRSKKTFLTFEIRMPEYLHAHYDYLQDKLNSILGNPELMLVLEGIDPFQARGNVWRAYHAILKSEVSTWRINNKAWFARMVYENLRRLIASKKEAVAIYQVVQSHPVIDAELREILHGKGLYPKLGLIKNLQRSKTSPVVPKQARFVMDYSVSDPQMFTMNKENNCSFKIGSDWFDYQIIIPGSANRNLTGRVTKPKFVKRDGVYKGYCSYEIAPVRSKGDNVLGVDLGKIKLFSATALTPEGEHSEEIINSRYVEHLNRKVSRLYAEKAKLLSKVTRIEELGLTPPVFLVRELSRVSSKIERLKQEVSKLVALEVVETAVNEDCGVIHLENLSWLESKGGKWNHSFTQKWIEEQAVKNGVRVKKVNAKNSSREHPITGELSRSTGRVIVFSNGDRVDRDRLASINLASRGGSKKTRVVRLRTKNGPTPKRPKRLRKPRVRDKVKISKGSVEIVTFSLSVGFLPRKTSLVLDKEVIANSSLLLQLE